MCAILEGDYKYEYKCKDYEYECYCCLAGRAWCLSWVLSRKSTEAPPGANVPIRWNVP